MSVGYSETSLVRIELPDIAPSVPYVVDDCSLAFQLGYRTKTLWWAIHCKKDHYEVHRIPKKRKGFRTIHAPSTFMKGFQRRLHTKFLVPLQNQLGPHVTAYRKGLSTRHAVVQHIPPCEICDTSPKGETPKKHSCPRRGTVIQMDLQDFFGSTRRSWIRNFFKEQGYNHYTAGLLASLMTVDDIPNPKPLRQRRKDEPEVFTGVPQGAPTSGALCNLIADWRIDHQIMGYLDSLSEKMELEGDWKWRYTRYSDDLCLTCGRNIPAADKRKVCDHVTRIIQKAGYRLNPRKTRLGHSYYRKTLLGMVFNEKPNIPREKYLKFRAMVHNALTQGVESQFKRAGFKTAEMYLDHLRGNVNYIAQIIGKSNKDRAERLQIELELAIENFEAVKQEQPWVSNA